MWKYHWYALLSVQGTLSILHVWKAHLYRCEQCFSDSYVCTDYLQIVIKCDSVWGGSRWGLRFCTSEKLPHDVSAAGPWYTLSNKTLENMMVWTCWCMSPLSLTLPDKNWKREVVEKETNFDFNSVMPDDDFRLSRKKFWLVGSIIFPITFM